MQKVVLCFAILVCLLGSVYGGQTYYVSLQGSNSSNGSQNTPWRTLEYAITVAGAGDTIIMRGGTYTMGEVFIDRQKGRGGAAGQYLTIKAYPGEEPILQPGTRRLIIWADYVRVEGLHLIMPWRCDAFGTGLQIVNNQFTGPQPKYGAIETGGTNILIEGNYIEYDDNGGNTMDHGIYVHAGSNITIKNNTVIGSKGYGIHVYDEQKSSDPNLWKPMTLKNYVIDGNLVMKSQSRSGIIVARGRGGNTVQVQNIQIQRNIFVNNAMYGVLVRDGDDISVFNNTFVQNYSTDLRIENSAYAHQNNVNARNNIFIGSEGGHVVNLTGSSNITLNGNLYNATPILQGASEPNAVIGNPQFVDPSTYNYELKYYSPAIDAGTYVGLPYSGAAPDMGAFEFEEGVTPVEMVSFEASAEKNRVTLEWKTASETNNFGFDVERSRDNTNFTKIAFVQGHGTVVEAKRYKYSDQGLNQGRYFYRLKQVDTDGSFEYSAVIEVIVGVPKTFSLHQNYPNPFNPETQIKFETAVNSHIILTVYDITGRTIKKLTDKNYSPGIYTLSWEGKNEMGKNVASGAYFYKLEILSENSQLYSQVKRMILIR